MCLCMGVFYLVGRQDTVLLNFGNFLPQVLVLPISASRSGPEHFLLTEPSLKLFQLGIIIPIL